MRKLKITELNRISAEEFKTAEKLPLIVVLDHVRSLYNVGSVFRSSDAFRVASVYLCGITATPPQVEIHKTALGAEDSMNWVYYERTQDAVEHLKAEGYEVWAVEAVAVWNEEAEEVTVFAVNRNLEEDLPLTMDLRSFEGYELIGKTELVSDDLQTVNSAAGEKVQPRQADDAKAEGGQLETVLRKASWNVIRLGRK